MMASVTVVDKVIDFIIANKYSTESESWTELPIAPAIVLNICTVGDEYTSVGWSTDQRQKT
jgi:hypothetical protein